MTAERAARLRSPARRLLVPEVVQTSGMDCGPACLTALLAGFGVQASYGRLREACQTDVDGTSIDALEELAVQLGLDAEQVMIPVDHLLLPEARALPAIVVVRLPNGFAHFVVLWRSHWGRLQIMDPATGRRWAKPKTFLSELFVHSHSVPAGDWRAWAGSEDFLVPLRRRIRNLGAAPDELVAEALADPSWRALARLDAAVRLAGALLEASALGAGREAGAFLADLCRPERGDALIPAGYWSVRPPSHADADAGTDAGTGDGADDRSDDAARDDTLMLRGAVLVRARGKAAEAPRGAERASLDLERVRSEPRPRPGREIARLMALDGRRILAAFAAGALMASGVRVLEAILFRGLLDLVGDLGTVVQRAVVCAMVALIVAVGAGIRYLNERTALKIGRRVEIRLRLAFLRKLPRLGHRYFRSRPVSDLAERAYNLKRVRQVAAASRETVQAVSELAITALAMALLAPQHAVLILSLAVGGTLLPLLALPLVRELDLRMRTHLGALGRFQLDASLGLVAIRSHRAERCLRREQLGFLGEYVSTRLRLHRAMILIEGLQAGFILAGVVWIVYSTIFHEAATGRVLLLAYWGLSLPLRGRAVVHGIQGITSLRNIVLRILEPLGAREEGLAEIDAATDAPEPPPAAGPAAVELAGVTVIAGGHTLISGVDLRVAPGEHVAVVGPSGAGKTTLVGLLLGRHTAARGAVRVDGEPLAGAGLHALRSSTAWVDPAVQVWNRSLLENLRYGAPEDAEIAWDRLLDECELRALVSILPDGLRTPLGESGGLVSGGEGQRVRLGRATTRRRPRLAILDEPFRGLARGQRQRLLERCRTRWRTTTLLCVTHDIEETLGFDRVVVMEGGRTLESGAPRELAERDGGAFRSLLETERRQRRELWGEERWRTLWMEGGRLGDRGQT